MKNLTLYSIFLWISLFMILPTIGKAVHSTNHNKEEQKHILSSKKKKKPKKGLLKKWLSKIMVKKFQKAAQTKNTIKKRSNKALLFGILAFTLLISGVLFIAVEITLGLSILGAAGILAILGDIFAISALKKIKNSNDPSSFRKERKKAKWGLTLALLTGIIPLLALLLALGSS